MKRRGAAAATLLLAAALLAGACRKKETATPGAASAPPPPSSARPSILLVTLDTTRADAIGPQAQGIDTPAFNTIAARGRLFTQAYATVPETLPSHASMMTGLYPAGHGVHENARYLPADRPLLAPRLKQAGYRTAAFVSSFTLIRRFGLARGFEHYDDVLADGGVERSSADTTQRALSFLAAFPESGPPLFLWVHYFDPHAPYEPPEPFRSRFRKNPYLGEVATMDAQLGRLVEAFERRVPDPRAVVIAADHGEGLGAHGELQHGNLLYQETMHVPLVLAGPGVTAGVSQAPVSTRRIFHTILDWAGLEKTDSLRGAEGGVVLGEAMKPFLSFGWQPQVMGVFGSHKAIYAGRLEAYNLAADPAEARDLAGNVELPRELSLAVRDYPVPSLEPPAPQEQLGEEELKKLASLGYISATSRPQQVVRPDAPRPADMAPLFETIESASGLFVRGEYKRAIPLFEKILAEDPHNLDAALKLASAYSSLGDARRAEAAFERASRIAPDSPDVRTYLALHYARGPQWPRAAPLLEQIVQESPDRLPALEALAVVRERQGRAAEAAALRRKVYVMRPPTAAELIRLGELSMSAGETAPAIDAFEKARAAQGPAFARDLELGVLYLDARRFPEARDALDRVPPSHPGYPMALFKRAQVSVLLNEPDSAARIAAAKAKADATTRELIARERLFQGTGAP